VALVGYRRALAPTQWFYELVVVTTRCIPFESYRD